MSQRKPYNPNTKYGRRKLRDQAAHRYNTGTPEYRQQVDEIGCGIWAVFLIICAIIFIIIAVVSGPEKAVDWVK